jgi:hypothetical protein
MCICESRCHVHRICSPQIPKGQPFASLSKRVKVLLISHSTITYLFSFQPSHAPSFMFPGGMGGLKRKKDKLSLDER